MKIKIIDPVVCQTDSPKILGDFLKIKKEYWRKGEHKKEKQEYEMPLVDKNGFFLSGFLPRVKEECYKRNIELSIEGKFEFLKFNEPKYPEIKLFPDQDRLVGLGLKEQRGIIQSPTGTGKTVLCYALIYPCLPCKALVICPSKSILYQTAKEFKEKFKMKVSICHGKERDFSGDVVVSIINTLKNIEPEKYCSLFDIVIVDECHHASSDKGMYYQFLSNCLAPIRIGLTATTDNKNSKRGMFAEGLLGPVIGKFTFEEAVKAKRIAKPKLVLLPVPINSNTKEARTYKDIYDIGIVFNRIRNNIISDYIKKESEKNRTCIAFVKFLDHADVLIKSLRSKGVICEYVAGSIDNRERERIKLLLEEKKIHCVVATAAWREGVNVPSLDYIVNAAGYLSEKAVLQMAGRAFRISEKKENGIVVDLLDSGKYLSEHCVRRLLVYAELGWI